MTPGGVINQVRGWFPSNYCQIITSPNELPDLHQNGHIDQLEDDGEDADLYDDHYEQDDSSDLDGANGLPIEGNTTAHDKSRADFWIPQATPDGRLFYYNMMTGDRSMELPLESPTSANETGPPDRINVHIPDRTRPPAEMLARGFTQDEDDDSATSASEAEGESLRMMNSRTSTVRVTPTTLCLSEESDADFRSRFRAALAVPSRRQHRWILSMVSCHLRELEMIP